MTVQLSLSCRTNKAAQLQASVGGNAWAADTNFATNALMYNGSQYYQCTTGGLSASSGGGPTGTGTGITDGTCVWQSVQPVLKVFSGTEPANCAAADPSGLLVTMNLPAPLLTVSSGATALAGTWSGAASGAGTAASFRIYDGTSAVNCHCQGAVGMSGSDLNLNNTSIASGQTVSVTSFALTEPAA